MNKPVDGIQLLVNGRVQGVGFRPFVYRLAKKWQLVGSVRNTSQGVAIQVAGDHTEDFLHELTENSPTVSDIHRVEQQAVQIPPTNTFSILPSDDQDAVAIWYQPDLAMCPKCRMDMLDPNNRRFGYPFTSCTDCGPRYAMTHGLPYDRCNTTMAKFSQCEQCQREYDDPMDRRFHSQPNACPNCGPQVWLTDHTGQTIDEPWCEFIVNQLNLGKIIALKTQTGFHLLADPSQQQVIERLREIKSRPHKPFALMVADIVQAKKIAQVSQLEEQWLSSPVAPIVLLDKKDNNPSQPGHAVAPNVNRWGVMLPYTGLHHLVMAKWQKPLIATSGNRAGEPVCYDNEEALESLNADYFLLHDFPIFRPLDDSVVQVVAERIQVIRASRGLVPLSLPGASIPDALAFGGQLKNNFAITHNQSIRVSQYFGDLDHVAQFEYQHREIARTETSLNHQFETRLTDDHPNYRTNLWLKNSTVGSAKKTKSVQHHLAHFMATYFDRGIQGPALGLIWDGVGFGLDKQPWGGECLRFNGHDRAWRIGHLQPMPLLPQSERDNRRMALAVTEHLGDPSQREHFSSQEQAVLLKLLKNGKLPKTTSLGRLFDAVAYLLDACTQVSYEGQGAIQLQALAESTESDLTYSLPNKNGVWQWQPLVLEILQDIKNGVPPSVIAHQFHNALAKGAAESLKAYPESQVVLGGGCFQNRLLVAKLARALESINKNMVLPNRLPINDGAIAVGQIAAQNIDFSLEAPCV